MHVLGSGDEIKPAENAKAAALEDGRTDTDSFFMGVDPMAWNILVGDCAHNIADGFIIASAFGIAGVTTGWIVGKFAFSLSCLLANDIFLVIHAQFPIHSPRHLPSRAPTGALRFPGSS